MLVYCVFRFQEDQHKPPGWELLSIHFTYSGADRVANEIDATGRRAKITEMHVQQ